MRIANGLVVLVLGFSVGMRRNFSWVIETVPGCSSALSTIGTIPAAIIQ